MNGVTIYMEGGGKGPHAQRALRRGMDTFLRKLKDATRAKSLRWKLVCCGSRNKAFEAFRNAQKIEKDTVNVLLVDAEELVKVSPIDHLWTQDGWKFSKEEQDFVHLMTQTMETWIIADPEAMCNYYEDGFKANSLPKASDLETVTKAEIDRALKLATKDTQKKHYHKIHHAGDLLALIDPSRVRQRCSYCERLFTLIEETIVN
ncbi:MAG: DUF4276 family protein [Aestuariivita sp.]|nr:DUF4276 family protein [Aestuariivita sp.]MCY4347741.1 DUF4276 family protein [Aestuariivita sp.]